MKIFNSVRGLPLLVVLLGCAHQPEDQMKAATNIDMQRFMGDWYVLANIPTFADRDALRPTEHYRMNDDGTVAITFRFFSPDRPDEAKSLSMKGFTNAPPGNGVWRVQWVWPFKADYRIAYVDENYEFTVIGRNKRDYVWLMAREPDVGAEKLDFLINQAVELGYDRDKIELTSWQQPLLEAG